MTANISDALNYFYPLCDWDLTDVDDYSTLVWRSKAIDKPSESTINTLKSEIEFTNGRSQSYPPIGEQLDMLWHAIDEEKLDKTSKFYTTLKLVKDVYPKTSVGITTHQGTTDTQTNYTIP